MTEVIRYTEAVGRRKTASARVRLYPGTGEIVVNQLPMEEYFGRDLDRMALRSPLVLTGNEAAFNISVQVKGGGDGGQADAVRHGISRALCLVDITMRPALEVRRLSHPRCSGQGTEETRSQACPQGASVHQALNRLA